MTDKYVLILGHGRAGKRHHQMAKDLGLEVYVFDPFLYSWQGVDALDAFLKEFAIYCVICTPPDTHLAYIRLCLDAGVSSILCEKPLCAIGQLDEAKALPEDAPVMVAYNFRYHPKLIAVSRKLDTFQIQCEQNRSDLPDWGLLLDHCSHDLDIARMIARGDVDITHAHKTDVIFDQKEVSLGVWCWNISTNRGPVSEMVTARKIRRQAIIRYPYPTVVANQTKINIDPDPAMFTAMWQAFLDGRYWPDLAEAIKTQELLEKCYTLGELLCAKASELPAS